MIDLRQAIRSRLHADEAETVRALVAAAGLGPEACAAISARAAVLVRAVRSAGRTGLLEQFLSRYGLSTREGVALMCLAEALLRVPDATTVDELIRDKIAPHDWGAHLGAGSVLVNASTWALMLTGRVLEPGAEGVAGTLRALVRRLGEPVIRAAATRAMRELGDQFVLGETIGEALARSRDRVARGQTFSYDMLGEAARTRADAARYHAAYAAAITALAAEARGTVPANPGISVKLSALHPRYEWAQRERMLPELVERLVSLARAAAGAGIGLNIDAEEADRLELSLEVIETALADPALSGWDGFGVVVQAYGKRALPVIGWLHDLAGRQRRRLMVRLVKGAYWDSEVKRAQVAGLPGYPVFTRKAHTDVSYLACARALLGLTDRLYPQFATHNAHTVAAVLEMAGGRREAFEFQRLHGMGEVLHDHVAAAEGTRLRIYAPVGAHRDLLAYLVRRLLENGANSSFVHQIVNEEVPPEAIAADPIAAAAAAGFAPNPRIPTPAGLYGPGRVNSRGWDLADPLTLAGIEAARAPFAPPHRWQAGSAGPERAIVNPASPADLVGTAREADAAAVAAALARAAAAAPGWAARPVAVRAAILRRASDLFEAAAGELFALLQREAGKTLPDAVAELREAVDFLRYYAAEAPGAEAGTRPRGVIGCISPWNFPLAIFTGQVAAALATGNAVLAKPAEQTPLVAARAVALLHEAGVPAEALVLLPGDGRTGAALTALEGLGGICFTGSTEVAKLIDRQLAATAPDAMLIAETGGLNAMIVDSTALPEQAVRDILASAFQSAGQRCSALRILLVQEEVAPTLREMLAGTMDTLVVGDPWRLESDVGPVIDAEARAGIEAWLAAHPPDHRLAVPATGTFVSPSVITLPGIEALEREVFGPVLHLATFAAEALAATVAAVNARGYGLTLGLHTRIDARVQQVVDAARVGNLYVNRNQIGAVVGVQPFGGEGLSGTGPKAGGPHYLPRFRVPAEAASAPAAPAPAAPAPAAPAALFQAALATLPARGWGEDRIGRLRAALRGRAAAAMAAVAALDMGPIDLPGPTGEANQLRLVPRGIVLALGPDPEALLAQTVLALGTGNRVLAAATGADDAIAPLRAAGAPVAAVGGGVAPALLARLPVDAVALARAAPGFAAVRRALAGREGPILPLVSRLDRPAEFALERTLTVDTTAAGGNAELMARSG